MTRLLCILGFHDRCWTVWTQIDGRDVFACRTDHREGQLFRKGALPVSHT